MYVPEGVFLIVLPFIVVVFHRLNIGKRDVWGGGRGQVGAIAFLTRDHFLFNTTFPFEQNNAGIMIQLSTDYHVAPPAQPRYEDDIC